jgi:hypothetical protein
MKQTIRNPHTFDMSPYFSGEMYVIGGRDFEREEAMPAMVKEQHPEEKVKIALELDWSFLRKSQGPSVK